MEDLTKLTLRLSLGLMMLSHGMGKFAPQSIEFISTKLTAVNLPAELVYGVYLGEIVAPILVIIGLFTRLGGWIMVVNMLFAIGLVHMNDIFALTERGAWAIETQALFLVVSLAVAVFGSGKYAVKPNGVKTAEEKAE